MTGSTYRGWPISYDHPPIPVRDFDWSATHPDYDGGDADSTDSRHVAARTRPELIAAIDDWHAENAPVFSNEHEANMRKLMASDNAGERLSAMLGAVHGAAMGDDKDALTRVREYLRIIRDVQKEYGA